MTSQIVILVQDWKKRVRNIVWARFIPICNAGFRVGICLLRHSDPLCVMFLMDKQLVEILRLQLLLLSLAQAHYRVASLKIEEKCHSSVQGRRSHTSIK